jgi:hypothetical protein
MAVYFIQNPDTGHIKIGKSFMVNHRLKVLSKEKESELQLLGVVPGGLNEERGLHLEFDNSRYEGEWFSPTAELLEFIKSNTMKLNELPEEVWPTRSPRIESELDQELIALIQNRRNRSYDAFARIIQIQTITLIRFCNGDRGLGIKSIRLIAAWARKNNDGELIQALTRYALGPQ